MNELFNSATAQMIFQLFLATVLGMAIGFERRYRKKSYGTAGMRTLGLVALGSALLTILSVGGFSEFVGISSYDPSRIAGQIVVGIGFLGAGLIFIRGGGVRGLTTAASVWVVAAIGMAVGLKFYILAVVATIIALLLLSVLRYIDIIAPEDKKEELWQDDY